MSKQYVITHCHTELSNGVTNIDSVTNFNDYINYISEHKELGVRGICLTEHGSLFEWYKKKCACEEKGLKYIHAVEAYVTESLNEKIRDNYHVCLYATDFESFKELNKLISKSFNREDGHFYYAPRITYEELKATSNKIIITTACLGGILNKGNVELQNDFIKFLTNNKDRCYLELQHHLVKDQIIHNKKLYDIHKQTNIPLIIATDTHCLNKKHEKGREILQKAKNIYFDNEEGWDLKLKSYDELIELFKNQNIMDVSEIEEALNNTNNIYDRVESFELDKSYKYPKLCDNPKKEIQNKIINGIKEKGIDRYLDFETKYMPRIQYEMETYEHNKAFDFLLLDENIKSWGRENDIYCGYSRGSCSGSEIAYIIGITDIDPLIYNLNFERFMNIERVSLADIDTDWQPNHRDIIKKHIYQMDGLHCADIITFNTVALKGSVRDVCRALYKKEPNKELKKQFICEADNYGKPFDSTSKKLHEQMDGDYLKISNYICDNIETNEDKMRKEYPQVFEYVDIINGTIVSLGTHPCGQVCSPVSLDDNMGLCTIAKCDNPVTMINMKEIDAQNYVKLDILGLDNIQLINETCELANIERLNPQNVPDEEKIWLSMAKDNTLIFQWESDSAKAFLRQLLSNETISKIKKGNPNFKYLDLVTMGNGAIRPAGSSYRDALSKGEFRDNGHCALNELLAPTNGYLVYQEQILDFLHQFCGYTMGEADIVRRGFAKKTGTEQFIPKIKDGFIKTMYEKYNVSKNDSERIVESFIQVIIDASSYLFSLNHSLPYTYIGYIGAYLRYYYPLEFLTVALNINVGKEDKTIKITEYANKIGIKILPPKFRYSKGEYFMSEENNSIYKGGSSIKGVNNKVSDELYELKDNQYDTFLDLLIEIKEKTSCNSAQLEALIKLNYFEEFGKTKYLLKIVDLYNKIYTKKQFKKATLSEENQSLIRSYAKNETEKMFTKVDTESLVKEVISKLPNESLPIKELMISEIEYLGYISYTDKSYPNDISTVTEIKINTWGTPFLTLYQLSTGKSITIKVNKRYYENKPLNQFDMIKIVNVSSKKKKRKDKDTGKWIQLDETENILESYSIVIE